MASSDSQIATSAVATSTFNSLRLGRTTQTVVGRLINELLLLDAFFHKHVASIAKRPSDAISSSINKLEDKHIAATGFA
ncbi:unnamed protein product [Eruca vesicaria subsp. sativa]|uniref:Uncharacterized protein n=1 Tax=Eruca vesicaria subsp. sativa TaxID=29727 RepID=A0ABC8LHE0_ERUVS|nr:unnamed protein product [Eruca vesicaria subsp. sativa]